MNKPLHFFKFTLIFVICLAPFMALSEARPLKGNETDDSGTSSSIEQRNLDTVLQFYNLAFNQHQPRLAAEKFIGQTYTQHNPLVGDGADAFVGYFEPLFEQNPNASVSFKHQSAQDDLVWLHLNLKMNSTDRGLAIIDLFRLEDGKIVEHWDVIQTVPEQAANNNTMF
ncbi:uncharacterized protein VTP21DRAFT_5992 [Calcarisporiella thermophila]|uniref:uncharacterized protein n=1 Tax=Calcarisporiella thermophila TaxID=911321 RepID=UPI00374330CB